MVEMVRQEEKDSKKEKYPWLNDTDERKYMTGREILDKHIDLKDSYLEEIVKGQVIGMLYRYKVCLV